jgi:hypothetical protein
MEGYCFQETAGIILHHYHAMAVLGSALEQNPSLLHIRSSPCWSSTLNFAHFFHSIATITLAGFHL